MYFMSNISTIDNHVILGKNVIPHNSIYHLDINAPT